MQTLKGIFPEKKSNHRKNFVRENVRKIKQHSSQANIETNEKALRPQYGSTHLNSVPSQSKLQNEPDSKNRARKVGVQKLEIKPSVKRTPRKEPEKDETIVHRSMQTETTDNLDAIYSKGVIKYPSPSLLNALQKKDRAAKMGNVRKKPDPGHGDSTANDDNRDIKVDFIKQNMQIKNRISKRGEAVDPGRVPNSYKKGVVPKYIKQRREQPTEDTADVDCPTGHVLLPEEERKETLKVLRESYAEKIQELNSMPVRSDTLKMQKRKMELEEELKKIDEGIKVFQRPKVFVRICV